MRKHRQAIAAETVTILDQGFYLNRLSKKVDLAESIEACVNQTKLYLPEQLDELMAKSGNAAQKTFPTTFSLNNETTLEGAEAIARGASLKKVTVLNFASAKNPGGGFLNGSQAQEESLARCSALTASLQSQFEEFYAYHRHQIKTCLYTDRIIYSPRCPVFRNDQHQLLDQPYFVDFITSPAPNAGAIRQNEPEKLDFILPTLKQRAEKIIALALHHQCDYLILGAWGCGVFKNEPSMVAKIFLDSLIQPQYQNKFDWVRFSVLDRSQSQTTFQAFQETIA